MLVPFILPSFFFGAINWGTCTGGAVSGAAGSAAISVGWSASIF